MRVVVAPDSFGGTLSAVEAAEAIAAGWREPRRTTSSTSRRCPTAGPVSSTSCTPASAASWSTVTVDDPLGRPVPRDLLLVGRTAYVESAQACGLHLMAPERAQPDGRRRPAASGSCCIARPGEQRQQRGVVVGPRRVGHQRRRPRACGSRLAGSSTPSWSPRPTSTTRCSGPTARARSSARRRAPTARWCSTSTTPCAPGRTRWRRAPRSAGLRDRPGAGAAGGLGFALFALGATRASGLELVAEAVGLADRVAAADLVVTGEGRFDSQSLRGKVPRAWPGSPRSTGCPAW